jgi:enoyl-CoA hydratase/carnithine racemase
VEGKPSQGKSSASGPSTSGATASGAAANSAASNGVVAREANEHASEILCETRNRVAFITLNRPNALNALSFAMLGELRAELLRCAADPEVRAVLLRGAGDKAFCAGGDIRALYQSFKDSGSLHHDFFVEEYRLDYFLYGYPKPYVVLLDGITMGGGMGVAQASTLRIAGERTRIAMPEVGIGLFPDVGASYFLSRLPGALGPYLALTGLQIRGADAVYARLADVYLAPAAIASLADDLAGLAWTEDGNDDLRRLIHARAAVGLPAPSLSVLRPAIDLHFSHASVAQTLASLDAESRPQYQEWAQQTAKVMRTRSPTMLSVALRQLQRGKSMSLADCFRMELGMVEQCFEQGDFIEGIRALLVEKDNSPRWTPPRLAEVTDAMVEDFFRARWRAGSHPLADLEIGTMRV